MTVAWLLVGLAVAITPKRRDPLRTQPLRRRTPVTDAAVPLTLDLIAAALRAGRPVGVAVRIGAEGAGAHLTHELERVAALLDLGADPAEAWRVLTGHPTLGPVAVAARRSATSGIRLAAAFEQLADDIRRDRMARGEARAQRAGVWAMAPLGLCFLPAFVCLGVVPIIIGIVQTAFVRLG